MTNRTELLRQLLDFSRPLAELKPKFSEMEWDSEILVILDRIAVVSILRRYIAQERTGDDVEEWANAVEGREDIGFEPQYSDVIRDILFELANPELTQPLDLGRAKFLLEKIDS